MRIYAIYITFISLLIGACSSHKALDPMNYVSYVQDAKNGLLVKEKFNGIGYTLQYQPANYLVFMELRSFQIPEDTFKMQFNRFKGLEHYNLQIDKKTIDSISKQSKNQDAELSYFDFGIKKDLKLIEGNDTLKCAICECESDGGIKPYYSLLLGFPIREYKGDRQLVLEGKNTGMGEVRFFLTGNSISNIPDLKLM